MYCLLKYFITAKPLVQPLRKLHPKVLFDLGKVFDFEFGISGYPLPKVNWSFVKCSKYPTCDNEHTRLPVIVFIIPYFHYIL